MTIWLFTTTGATFTFRNASVVTDNETVLAFTYKAMSDGKVRTHTAFKKSLVGISVSE